MSDTLKPCPFCGSDGFVNQHPDAPEYWVACSRCSALTDTALPTEAEAIAAWNRRAAIGQVEQPTLPLTHVGEAVMNHSGAPVWLSAAPPAPAPQQPARTRSGRNFDVEQSAKAIESMGDAELAARLRHAWVGEQPQPSLQQPTCGGRDYCSRFPFCGCGEPPLFPERDPNKPAEQQGMFRKFEVRRVDGSSQPGGKHYGCRYFVLDLGHDKAAPAAMRAYATEIAPTHPQLAADIQAEFGAQPVAPDPITEYYTDRNRHGWVQKEQLRKVAEAVREAARKICFDWHRKHNEQTTVAIRAIDIDALIEQVKGK